MMMLVHDVHENDDFMSDAHDDDDGDGVTCPAGPQPRPSQTGGLANG